MHLVTQTQKPGQLVYMDILPAATNVGLTPKSSFQHFIIFVDALLQFCCILGLVEKSSEAVVNYKTSFC